MRKHIATAFILLIVALLSLGGDAAPCYVQSSLFLNENWTYQCPMNPNNGTQVGFTKTQYYHLVYPGPAYTGKNPRDVSVPGNGQAITYISGGNQICRNCFPEFGEEINQDRYWAKEVDDIISITIIDENTLSCPFQLSYQYYNPLHPVCSCPANGAPGCIPNCPQGCAWNEVYCTWDNCGQGSPIIIDLENDGYNLTNAANGVNFDLKAIGTPQRWSWTAGGSDDAFLALDRNNDGRIDSGKELFGNFTDQPISEDPNGFIALAVFDDNNDRWIDRSDAIYSKLMLWVDSNHNGISERNELHSLEWGGIERIGLDYSVSRRSDQHGNNFRFRARVSGRDLGRWAWDIFLSSGQ